METLLLIEDERLLRHVLKENLEEENFFVLEASNGMRSVEIVSQHRVDLILLDLRLPDGSGIDLISRIRRFSNAPIIIISGEMDKAKKMSSFSLGVDDYIGKPFDTDELIARIRASLRRSGISGEASKISDKSVASQSSIKLETWVLDRGKFQIFDEDGRSAALTFREFQLLDILISNAGKVMSRDDLCGALREKNYILSPRAIDTKITRIRKKIGDDADNPRLIKTVRGAGYFFEKDKIENHR